MIKDIKYQIVEQTLESGRINYVIGVEYKSKGMLWGWNERVFILEHEPVGYALDGNKITTTQEFRFIDNLDTFNDAWDRQNTSNAYRLRFVQLDTIEECNETIEKFKQHCQRELEFKKDSSIKSIKII
jgi:hypothetical protein